MVLVPRPLDEQAGDRRARDEDHEAGNRAGVDGRNNNADPSVERRHQGLPRTDSGGALGGLRRVKAAQGLPPSPDVDEACAVPSPLTTAQA